MDPLDLLADQPSLLGKRIGQANEKPSHSKHKVDQEVVAHAFNPKH